MILTKSDALVIVDNATGFAIGFIEKMVVTVDAETSVISVELKKHDGTATSGALVSWESQIIRVALQEEIAPSPDIFSFKSEDKGAHHDYP